MSRLGRWPALAASILCLVSVARGGAREARLPSSTRLVLDNGFEAILIPNRGVPLVASVVVVRAGVINESPAVNGISHMLEHLLFNGTARRTQEQIYDEQDRYGIINNASTGTEQTAYFVMAARETAGRALDLQADMLFGSVFPEDKLAKEREIIVNEIAKDRVQDETVMAELYSQRTYHPSSLALPVIGTPETVRAIPREAILDYYKRLYAPDNMTAIIMGDFDADEMEPLVKRYFGAAAPAPLSPPPAPRLNLSAQGLTHARRTAGSARLLWVGAPAPGIETADYGPYHVLASLLSEGLTAAVNARLRAAKTAEGSLLEVAVDLDGHRSCSSLRVRASLEPGLSWNDAASALLDEITARLTAVSWKTRDLDRVRLQERAALMRLWEKPHYYGLDRAPVVAAAGWEVARDFVKRLGWIEPADLKDAARRVAERKLWSIFAVGPDAPEDRGAVSAAGGGGGMPDAEPTAASREMVARWKGPGTLETSAAASGLPENPARGRAGRLATARTMLPNGLTLLLDSSEDSRVFAAHVLVRHRSAAEPAGKTGMAEILHRMAGSATTHSPAGKLEERLAALGGTLKVTDDPSIPYDDVYLSPEYSYVRLEALDEFAVPALGLLAEILYDPDLSAGPALESAREQVLARVRLSGRSPRERCRRLLARGVWGAAHPFAAPLFGTEESVRSIGPDDLGRFHSTYFSPRNMIVAIGTSLRPEKILPIIEAKLGRRPAKPARPAKPPEAAPSNPAGLEKPETDGDDGPVLLADPLPASQAYLMLARLVPEEKGAVDAEAMDALAAVLSRRMGDILREQRGLSYSLGADAVRLAGRIQFTLSMGTLPEKTEEARAGLREVLLSLIGTPPAQQEIDDAGRATEVRVRMRGLSRINRGWKESIEELRREQKAPAAAATGALSAERVLAAARRILPGGSLAEWVEAVVAPEAPKALR